MENKKIKNATPKEYNGIKFKSLSEVMVYKTLLAEGFLPEYESTKFNIFNAFIPTIPFYTKNIFNRKNKNIEVISKSTVKDNRPQKAITYTPDFIFKYNGKTIIVEVKGMKNDTYPLKFKMFRYLMELRNANLPNSFACELWEIYSKKQLIELINILKNGKKKS